MTTALVPARETGAKTEVETACDEVDGLMREAIKRIDARFGEGFAKDNGALLGSFVEAAMSSLLDLRYVEQDAHKEDDRSARMSEMLENLQAKFAEAVGTDPITATRPKS